ncbi:hypothetical protein BMS83_04840, partial [Leuconostoc pseudomesenteroides]
AKQQGFSFIELSIDESDERIARLDWSDNDIFSLIPKERKIETVSAKELDQINHWINARPMKTLNWQSPRKVFQQFAVFG